MQDSDSGRYVCVAEYDGVKVFSKAADLDVFGKYQPMTIISICGHGLLSSDVSIARRVISRNDLLYYYLLSKKNYLF